MFELTTGVFIFHFLEKSFLPFMAEVRVSIPWTIVPDIFENDIYIYTFFAISDSSSQIFS